MAVTRILIEDRMVERRAVAFVDETPVALFLDSPLIDAGPRLGSRHRAVLREAPAGLDGGFAELESRGETVFVRLPKSKRPALGARLNLRIDAEARPGKQARASIGDPIEDGQPPFDGWVATIAADTRPMIERAGTRDAWDEIDAAMDAALSTDVPIAGGGRLTVSRTPALTAIDIDSAGRLGRGGRGQAARTLNLAAVRAAAETLALRGLGGLVVIDCVAPLPRALGPEIKAAFLNRFRALSNRKAEALAPSPFGLMEVSLAWCGTPIADLLLTGSGEPSPAALALDGLRQLQREAETDRMCKLVLDLPDTAYMALMDKAADIESRLHSNYGARLSVRRSSSRRIEVYRP